MRSTSHSINYIVLCFAVWLARCPLYLRPSQILNGVAAQLESRFLMFEGMEESFLKGRGAEEQAKRSVVKQS